MLYELSVRHIDGSVLSLETVRHNVLLVVNTASKCTMAPQLAQLEQLHRTYYDRGLRILAFPSADFLNQELGSNEKAQAYCVKEYGITFPLMRRVSFKGTAADPLFTYLTQHTTGKPIAWNYTKFLIAPQEAEINRYMPLYPPQSMTSEIERLLT